jgi:hypothetical protein
MVANVDMIYKIRGLPAVPNRYDFCSFEAFPLILDTVSNACSSDGRCQRRPEKPCS